MSYPERHTDLRIARSRGRWLRRVLRDRRPLDETRWHQIGRGLNEGDPLADAVVGWFGEVGGRVGRALFDRGLQDGLAGLSHEERAAHPPLVALLEETERPPQWLDRGLLERGGRVLDRCHPVPYYVLRNMGLLAGYSWRDLNKPLVMTGALRGGASRRVAQTMKWTADCIDAGGLDRGGPGYCSTLHVRMLHATFRARLARHRDWDPAEMGLPINQTDMAATWLAFSVVFLAGARLMGVTFSRGEARAVMHLWRYACWLMGVDDAWLTDDEAEGRRLLFDILSTYRGPDETSAALGRALMEDVRDMPYPGIRPLRWRVEAAKHLSTVALIAGPVGMRSLGLPAWIPPWYPAATFGWNAARSVALRLPTPLRKAAERRGRAERDELVRMHFRGDAPDLQEPEVAPT